jgi:hypothetical protein
MAVGEADGDAEAGAVEDPEPSLGLANADGATDGSADGGRDCGDGMPELQAAVSSRPASAGATRACQLSIPAG